MNAISVSQPAMPLEISGIAIRQDGAGRYCLNDLHRAAGGESKDQPSNFMRRAETAELIGAIENSSNSRSSAFAVIEGRNGGTYVCKELVYAYAMWISAAFHLRVIRAYDALVTAPAIPRSFAEALRLAAEQAERIEQQQALIEQQKPAVEFVGKYVEASTGSKTFREVCKLLKVKEPAFRAFLKDRGVMYQLGGAWVPYADHIDAGRFEVKTGAADNGHAFTSSRFTAKGVEWIAGEWAKHQVREAA